LQPLERSCCKNSVALVRLEIAAEFVENDPILEILTELGVNYAQGYGIHKPTSFDDVFA
jgi:EAL domain-containing protein (putative c-di-GMP-specific phosphodiesterase class I)